jgi:hypothetical protein
MAEFVNNFDKNLLEASVNKEDLLEAKKEWQNFREEKCIEKKTCICKHKIQNVRYYLNTHNGNIICCGTVCCNKFNLEQKEIDNKTLGKILKLKNPYNEYHQFLNIIEYLDYAKDELNSFMAKEIESTSNFEQLIILLDNVNSINKTYELDIFNAHIESIKQKLINVIPSYIESALTRDIVSVFDIMQKLGILSYNHQIPKADINIFKNCIQRIVEHHITSYSGYTTPKLQEKIDFVIKKIDAIKAKTGKSLILKDFFIEMNEKLKNKIQSIRDHNFAMDKARYEAQQKHKQKMDEKYYKTKYF